MFIIMNLKSKNFLKVELILGIKIYLKYSQYLEE